MTQERNIKGLYAHPDREKLNAEYVMDAPDGEWIGRLNDRAWGKSSNLFCYFTDLASGKGYRLSVFRSHSYRPYQSGPALDRVALGDVFNMKSGISRNGLPKLLKAEPLQPS